MWNRVTSAAVLAVAIAMSACATPAEPAESADTFDAARDVRASLAAQSAYMQQIAEAMPEPAYGWAPAPGVRTFAEQALHLAAGIVTMSDVLVGATTPVDADASGKSKADVIGIVADAFAHADRTLAILPDRALGDPVPWQSPMLDAATISKRQVLGVLRDHLAHHRGQLIVYLRLQGVVPPVYVGF